MIKGNHLCLPNRQEYLIRKKDLEENFINHTCPQHGLDPEKARYALRKGILNLEPSFEDWETASWAQGSITWAEGFNISCLACKSATISLPKPQSLLGKCLTKINLFKLQKRHFAH